MSNELFVYNTLTKKKEVFKPLYPPYVGLYVCGPTAYGDAHLGHARPAVTFDLLYRYLLYLGYKVRYVRNITDVGHLENDADEGEDKIAKKARLEQLEPMEIVQYYTARFHDNMAQLNALSPDIEPRATGHVIEQQEMIEKILGNDFAYEHNGSVYFDVEKYNRNYNYGKLSGRKLEDLISNTRQLEGQQEKKNSFDFALWKKAAPEHIMQWRSPWGRGYPGWHIECSVMSTKYLGEKFDIHGGGIDLMFPHHDCEIAQSVAASGKEAVNYWMHNNMVTINGQKMGKSLDNFITLNKLFSGDHKLLERGYDPKVVRFFMLQSQYRNPLDFSNQAVQAAEKGYSRLMNGIKTLHTLKASEKSTVDVQKLKHACFEALNDDLNTPVVISHLFDGVRIINSIAENTETISSADLSELKTLYNDIVFDILGLKQEEENIVSDELFNNVVNILLNERLQAKKNKDFETADRIRDKLQSLGLIIKDKKDGFEWELEE